MIGFKLKNTFHFSKLNLGSLMISFLERKLQRSDLLSNKTTLPKCNNLITTLTVLCSYQNAKHGRMKKWRNVVARSSLAPQQSF